MAYTAWSVVFGEQPTAAKWNQLGENDAGFKTGANIDDDAIIARHIADLAVSNAQMAADTFLWEKLYDSGEIGAAADSISSGTITARKYLMVMANLLTSGAITSNFRFNNDSGANYAFNRDSGDTVSATSIGTGNSTLDQYNILHIYNRSASPKPVIMFTMFGSASAAVAPSKDKTNGKWHNTSAQITRIDAINAGTGDFAAGSRLIVLGHD